MCQARKGRRGWLFGGLLLILGQLVPAEAAFTREFEACIEAVSDDVCSLHVAWASYRFGMQAAI